MANTTVDTLLIQIKTDMKSLKTEMDKIKKVSNNTSQNVGKGFENINRKLSETSKRATAVGLAIGTAFAGVAIKKIVGVGSEIENLQIRLNNLFGSAEEGAKAFDEMAKFASKVPFSLQQIQMGSGSLAAVAKDSEHLAELLQITGNVAAVTGLDFATTSMQIQRSFSAGIGAADLFRERAVGSLLGFKKGAEVTVEETIKAFTENFGEGGKFGKTTDQLAQTLTGTLSMIGDKVFNFQRLIADKGFFDEVKQQFGELDKFLEENGETLDELAKTVSIGLIKAFKGLVTVLKFVGENTEALKITLQALAGAFVAIKITQFVMALQAYRTAMIGATTATAALTAVMKVNPLFLAIGAGAGVLTAVVTNLDKIKNKLHEIAQVPVSPALQSFGAIDTSGAPDFSARGQMGLGEAKTLQQMTSDDFSKLLAGRPESENFGEVKKQLEEEIHLLGLKNDEEREFFELLQENEGLLKHEQEILREKFDLLKDLESQQEKQNDLMQEATSIMDSYTTEEEELAEKMQILQEAMKHMSDEDVVRANEVLRELQHELAMLDPMLQATAEIFDRAFDSVSQSIADSITEGTNLMESLQNVARSVVNQIIKEFIRLQVIKPIMGSIFGGGGGMGGGSRGGGGGSNIFGNVFSGLMTGLGFILGPETGGASVPIMNMLGTFGSSAISGITSQGGTSGNFGSFDTRGTSSFMMGGRAGGGTVSPSRAVMVGERGPEIFVPNSGGKIVPNHNMRSLGGQETVINQNINISTGVSQTVRAEVLNLLPSIRQETLQAVADSKLRGGTFASAFAR